MENRTRNLSAVAAENEIPDSPSGYMRVLYSFGDLPKGYDAVTLKEESAREAFSQKLTLRQAEDYHYKKQKNLIAAHEVGQASAKAELREDMATIDPIQADNLLQKIYADPAHAYNNEKAPQEMHDRAVFLVESLLKAKNGEPLTESEIETSYRALKAEGFPTFSDASRQRSQAVSDPEGRSSRSYSDIDAPAKRYNGTSENKLGFEGKETSSASGSVMGSGKYIPQEYSPSTKGDGAARHAGPAFEPVAGC